MRILIFHNWYQQAGGEDAVVRAEIDLLGEHGHDVSLLDADNKAISGFGAKVRTATNVAHSRAAFEHVQGEIQRVRPHVVHVHNFFPLLTPAILDASRESGVPIVHTLHNFRLLCPAATMLRDGRPCELCLSGSTLNAVRYRCYRDSYAGSAAVAWMVSLHRYLMTFQRKVDRFITLTQFERRVFARAGFPADRITVRANATADPGRPGKRDRARGARSGDGGYALFLGRLSSEKGIETLLKAWRDVPLELRIAGDGPYAPHVRAADRDPRECVRYLGYVSADEVHKQLAGAQFLVMPSECYESFGMVLIEAFAHGVPVIASDLGAMAEIVDNEKTGLLFPAGRARALAAAASSLAADAALRQRMGKAARAVYEERYTLERSYERLIEVYTEVTEGVRSVDAA
jgi:glycosyltransferase involved in cell wall biosynthesis